MRNSTDYELHTPMYFYNPEFASDGEGKTVFQNLTERLKNEFYTVIRTMQRLAIEREEGRWREEFSAIRAGENGRKKLVKMTEALRAHANKSVIS